MERLYKYHKKEIHEVWINENLNFPFDVWKIKVSSRYKANKWNEDILQASEGRQHGTANDVWLREISDSTDGREAHEVCLNASSGNICIPVYDLQILEKPDRRDPVITA